MKISVLGAGTMGSGIAFVAAQFGHQVVLCDAFPEAMLGAEKSFNTNLSRLLEKGKITQEKAGQIHKSTHFDTNLESISGSDLVIEAIIENKEAKGSLFQKVEELVSETCIIASNTSSLSITALAACCTIPGRFIGIHFFNPAQLMKLVEIIPAVQTQTGTTEKAISIIQSFGKTTVLALDTPGFIVNRVARPFYGEALRIYDEGIASFETIDWAMKTIGGFPMGPFELMDFIGHDINFTVTETVFHAFYNDARYMPSFTQKRLKEAGYLGRKTGKGFYTYTPEKQGQEPEMDAEKGQYVFLRILSMLVNEAAEVLLYNVASKEDLEKAMTLGVNYPKGLIAWAEEIGFSKIVNTLDVLWNTYHDPRYRCSAWLRRQTV